MFEEQVPLKPFTSFRVGGPARYFTRAGTRSELIGAVRYADTQELPFFLLGGGSNILVSDQGYSGLVIRVATRGMELMEEQAEQVLLKVAAGESWDAVVAHAVAQGGWGVENMSCIPGTMGAVPIQNVGAYGQEASQVVHEVDIYDRQTGEAGTLPAEACAFAYRSSIFNHVARGRYVVLSVTLRLQKHGCPNLDHQALRNCFTDAQPGLRQLRAAVSRLRNDGRLPDLDTQGNAGSFFQSPCVDPADVEDLAGIWEARLTPPWPDQLLPLCYPFEGKLKVPAAQLVRACGLADARVGGAACYPDNPAVIVNQNGQARAADIVELAASIRQGVHDQCGLWLPVEPELIGFDPVESDRLKGAG